MMHSIAVKRFESVLERVAKMLSSRFGIKVVFKSDICATNGKVIYLPSIPSNASTEFIEALQGFLDHEVAHIIFSDMKAFQKAGIKEE